jgi:hypothetical protein
MCINMWKVHSLRLSLQFMNQICLQVLLYVVYILLNQYKWLIYCIYLVFWARYMLYFSILAMSWFLFCVNSSSVNLRRDNTLLTMDQIIHKVLQIASSNGGIQLWLYSEAMPRRTYLSYLKGAWRWASKSSNT